MPGNGSQKTRYPDQNRPFSWQIICGSGETRISGKSRQIRDKRVAEGSYGARSFRDVSTFFGIPPALPPVSGLIPPPRKGLVLESAVMLVSAVLVELGHGRRDVLGPGCCGDEGIARYPVTIDLSGRRAAAEV